MVGASSRKREGLSLLLITLFCLPLLLSGVQAQEDDPRILSHERNTLYFYGNNDDGGASSAWQMWNHAQASDTDSDDSVGENNAFVPETLTTAVGLENSLSMDKCLTVM